MFSENSLAKILKVTLIHSRSRRKGKNPDKKFVGREVWPQSLMESFRQRLFTILKRPKRRSIRKLEPFKAQRRLMCVAVCMQHDLSSASWAAPRHGSTKQLNKWMSHSVTNDPAWRVFSSERVIYNKRFRNPDLWTPPSLGLWGTWNDKNPLDTIAQTFRILVPDRELQGWGYIGFIVT